MLAVPRRGHCPAAGESAAAGNQLYDLPPGLMMMRLTFASLLGVATAAPAFPSKQPEAKCATWVDAQVSSPLRTPVRS
eukprot:COSAG06_NODE_57746_length_279_cov_0.844444_1_plen_77_part_10